MKFFESVKMSLVDKFFCFKGRASKQEYVYFSRFFWCGFLVVPILMVLTCIYVFNLEVRDFEDIPCLWAVGFVMIVAIPHLSLCVRRLRDVGESGWGIIPMLLLCSLLPFLWLLWYYPTMNKPSCTDNDELNESNHE